MDMLPLAAVPLLALVVLGFFYLKIDKENQSLREKLTEAEGRQAAKLHELLEVRQALAECNEERQKLKRQIKDKPPQEKSQDLTDFLGDVKQYGYGFVRVDPGAVFLRSPSRD